MMSTPFQSSLRRGFTLVEVIIVVVITGIVGGIVAVFLRNPVQSYVDSVGRADLSDIADTAVRRMVREVRLAVPNSIRVSGSSIEFVPTKTGGRYLAAEDGPPAGTPYLNFEVSSEREFTVVGTMPSGRQAITAGDFIVLMNLVNVDSDPFNVYMAAPVNRAAVESVTGKVVKLSVNTFAQQSPSMAHPLSRFLVATTPVTFRCADGYLYRYSNYGWNNPQEDPPVPAGTRTILASNVSSCAFDYSTNPNTNAGLLGLTLVLQRAGNDGPISLTQQIHVDNTP